MKSRRLSPAAGGSRLPASSVEPGGRRRSSASPPASEQQIQRAIVQWFQLALHPNVAYCAIPNGGYRRRIEARIMKGLGTVPGAPDLVLWFPPGKSLCLEVKTEIGRVSESQWWFHAKLQWCGVPVVIVRSLEDAIEACKGMGVPMKADLIAEARVA